MAVPIKATGRCKFHGGRSLVGRESPAFKAGKYSNALPSRLLEKYEEALKDPALTSMTNELAVIDARLNSLLSEVDESGGAGIFRQLATMTGELKKTKDPERREELIRDITEGIDKGKRYGNLWHDVLATIEQRRKIAATEHQLLIAAGQMISAESARVLFVAISEVIHKNVEDAQARRAITQGLLGLMKQAGAASDSAVDDNTGIL